MILVIFIGICLIESELRPRLDVTKEKDLLLWYGKSKRDFIKIMRL